MILRSQKKTISRTLAVSNAIEYKEIGAWEKVGAFSDPQVITIKISFQSTATSYCKAIGMETIMRLSTINGIVRKEKQVLLSFILKVWQKEEIEQVGRKVNWKAFFKLGKTCGWLKTQRQSINRKWMRWCLTSTRCLNLCSTYS